MTLQRGDLHQYQSAAIGFAKARRRCALWLGLGLGKSASALTAISDLMDDFEVRRTLVVAPLRVAGDTWPNEVKKWAHVSHLKVALAIGTARARMKALKSDADILVINVENVPWLESIIGLKGELPWQMIVLDESSLFKNRGTIRFKAMRRMSAKADRILQLTATPAPNSYLDIWPAVYLLDRGQRLGGTFSEYKNRYFKQVDRDGRCFALKKGAQEVIHEKISDIVLTMQSRDYLDMPPQVPPIDISVKLLEKESGLYKKMERDFLLEVRGAEIEAVNASALCQKLQQLANGRVYDAEGAPHIVHDAKLEALQELVDEAGSEPLLVAYSHKADRDAILARFPQAQALGKSSEQIAQWNKKKIPILVVHPASAGHGLNLQFGSSILIFYGLTWSLELYLQLIGRLDRQGQTQPVRIYRLVTKGTVDEDIISVLSGKNVRQEALLNAMRSRVDAVTP